MGLPSLEDKRELAYKLFIEILAYQLASPVRWIETQNELLKKNPTIRRFIEIGPRTTLATMAKKSASKYAARCPQSSQLEFLSYQDQQDEILFRYPEESKVTEKKLPVPKQVSAPALTSTAQTHEKPTHESTESVGYVPSADVTLSAKHVVLAMTAQKLQRPFDQVPIEKTIRDLSGGKSTLQNELTGDLVAEFGKVPEGVEDMSLAALGEALQGGFAGKPGKQMAALISRLVSARMPAGFNQNAIQDYLQSRWGLSKGHSIIPMCFATTVEPQMRLSNLDATQVYLDELVNRYAVFQGVDFIAANEQNSQNTRPQSMVIDAASLDAFNKENRDFQRKQLNLLAKHLQVNIDGQSGDAQTDTRELEEKLQQWNAELDDQFFQGIQPSFDANKARQYDSWWNWAREELIRWLGDVSQDLGGIVLSSMDDRLRRTLNRWEPSCTDIIRSLLDTPSYTSPDIRPMLAEILRLGTQAQLVEPTFIYTEPPLAPKTIVSSTGRLEYQETKRSARSYPDVVRQGRAISKDGGSMIPFIHIKTRRDEEEWEYNPELTDTYHATLDMGATVGLTYSGKAVLVTGAGPDSIGAMVVKGLLAGGARVIVTTSRAVSDSAPFYQEMYRHHGARGSSLTLLPMNQASKQDCDALVEYIYGEESPTGGDLDYVVPFAAIPQAGELDKLNSKHELAFRAMLTNVLRLTGLVRRAKEKRRIDTRPTMIILPMSCNEGTFGGDGLYSESKLGLKTLFNRFFSETWSTYVTICGAVIGWTRGTGLMRTSNMVAAEIEKIGVITFTQAEMAFNILALMTPRIAVLAEDAPVYADLTGGFGGIWNVKQQIAAARQRLSDELDLRNALAEEDARHQQVLFGPQDQKDKGKPIKRANLNLGFPQLACHQSLATGLPHLEGMVDLSRTVVVVGFSELGPWGNARTRWEMEHRGQFSLDGYMEMAWIMGLIKHVDGELKGEPYVGWVDSETQSPVNDSDVPDKYHEHIMKHVGLRLISPDKRDGYDPSRKEYLHEVAVEEDLPPFECSKTTAEAFRLRHGNNVAVQSVAESDNCRIFVKKGTVLMIPKRIPFDQVVAGRIPKGWDPLRYGIPEDIVRQVDDTTLYTLCCVSEAFLSAGIHDPYEIYQHIHVSEVANCLGTGGGPMKAIRSLYRDRFLDRSVRGDIILEHFLNTTGAWVNMLLLSATGPIKTPVGACATALESLDTGCDAIQTGKCKVAIVGGCDDYTEELAYEFANIKATANGTEELAKGRLPSEISRPTASSRSGFAESAGSGVQILMSAELALEMGLPIYGILAYNQMAGDQIGRSIPAPGKGVLTVAREVGEAKNSPLLDFGFRRARFDEDVADLQHRWSAQTLERPFPERNQQMEQLVSLKKKEIQNRWTQIRQLDPSISPMKAALATWGLAVDDIGVVSMHGTSTKANEINEGDVINTQMAHLGRRKGNPLLCVCQKSLTGHPKAAAGAWQLNGCMQIIRDQIVPGNRNADNVDEHLRQYEHLVYPMESMPTTKANAVMVTSFGFGQKGAISIIVAPKYLFASLSPADYEDYRARVGQRQRLTNPEFVTRVLKHSLVQVKSQPPWKDSETMRQVFLDPNSRLTGDQYTFTEQAQTQPVYAKATHELKADRPTESSNVCGLVQSMLDEVTRSSTSPITGVGVDVESIASINTENPTFIERNFTPAERDYCSTAADPRSSFAGRWSAKEAVFKSLQTQSIGAGAAMQEIEIISNHGIPKVMLHGRVQEIAATKGISKIEVTISHSAETAIAVALATGI
ncbi:3-oxoacyl-synthase [Aspergillus steynii IBT 23096]|uniref:Fatty acid synthase subunit alpha n=1 Tax=Aspergillus steynii IBT 23096 TaxID=1392250 RepID=A0A2I2GFH2_9EURO|nr:3-oxoacyl-synthase [Aspergillus steynii IBT 23096]PLB51630.1 3-oxoacyl-synthase [Aspergillus steynii IBT 23096]